MDETDSFEMDVDPKKSSLVDKLIDKLTDWCANTLQSLVFNQLIIIVYEAVFIITSSVFVHFQRPTAVEPNLDTAAHVVSQITLYACMLLVLLLILVAYRISVVKEETLQKQTVKDVYGFLIE